ncbi:unnamed protein product [Linum trigynum]|uniref:Reverse transcriptase n=1 Tax=Linum trigynum TaxID=586398 RepID=A0AAV2DT62_9ROSI
MSARRRLQGWGLKVKTIITDISSRYGYIINYKKAWHVKQKALAAMFDDWEESYAFLPRLMNMAQNWTMNMAPSISFTALALALQREQ